MTRSEILGKIEEHRAAAENLLTSPKAIGDPTERATLVAEATVHAVLALFYRMDLD